VEREIVFEKTQFFSLFPMGTDAPREIASSSDFLRFSAPTLPLGD
jgi:hypothetical protein